MEHCEKLFPLNDNKAIFDDLSRVPESVRPILEAVPVSSRPKNVNECVSFFSNLLVSTNVNLTHGTLSPLLDIPKYPNALIIFVTLIGIVSVISITGNLCLAKVLYSKRFRLVQTDRIVLCLALSAFDRFVYIHGHTSSNNSSWSKWCRYVSTKSGSMFLLILPILCSLPLAISNCLHAHISTASSTVKKCVLHYTNEIIISLLISFYILPILFSFFLHAKLIYFIRSRHSQEYLTRRAYILPMKRQNPAECRRLNRGHIEKQDPILLSAQNPTSQRFILLNHELTPTSTTAMTTSTMAMIQSTGGISNANNSSNSSRSSRSSERTSMSSMAPPPTVLYKINCQANANANRTVVLLVLLLSFYVLCWGPYNLYSWYQIYGQNQKSLYTPSNETLLTSNLSDTLRRFLYINYSLSLLSMISMCFSFIFYFSLNKQARQEFSRLFGCICPWTVLRQHHQQKKNDSRRPQYRTRFPNQYEYQNERIKRSQPLLIQNRCDHFRHNRQLQNNPVKRTVINYGCQIQCCP
ncbi:unnamed protein product [Adineta ricciae]|uniref:G-protein coupled receptors family 1 profile domain-containing protein n=1 Tax=Adineta ricciae TaxID=249248 RepID=A0A814YPK7_ADIRI|nr:unnamed protein product [Adineta ricciae]